MKLMATFCIVLFFSTGICVGQDSQVVFKLDSSIVYLVSRYREAQKDNARMPGYRVQLIAKSGANSKKEANDVKARFLSKYPDIPAYVVYQQPNFKVRVGDFRDRYAAYRFYKVIKGEFPSGFIVNDEIGIPLDMLSVGAIELPKR